MPVISVTPLRTNDPGKDGSILMIPSSFVHPSKT
jgi:hypothetical protein